MIPPVIQVPLDDSIKLVLHDTVFAASLTSAIRRYEGSEKANPKGPPALAIHKGEGKVTRGVCRKEERSPS